MSPTTRSDSLKKKVQNREAYLKSAKRSLNNDFEATTSEAQPDTKKVAKRAEKNTNRPVPTKSQKRKRFNVGINTPKIAKKQKESEHVIGSDDDFQSNEFILKKKKRSAIKVGICRGKFARERLADKKNSQFRSTVPEYNNDTGNPITEGVRRIISQTPFAALFDLFFTGKLTISKSNKQLSMILTGYNHKDESFSFGGTHGRISVKDVENILGLSGAGEYIEEKGTPPSDFVVEAFGMGKSPIKKSDVADAITRELRKVPVSVIDVQERDQNLARLVLIDICIKFLFANGMCSLSMKHVRACEDLNEIAKYAWAKEILKYLNEKLKVYMIKNSTSKNTGGCIYIILYWLCLKTNILKPMAGMENALPLIKRYDLTVLEQMLKKTTFTELCARINGTDNDAYGMSMADLIKEVEDSRTEILILKTKSEEQELKIKRLEQIIEDSLFKSASRTEGDGEPRVNEDDSTDVHKDDVHSHEAQERRSPDNEPIFQERDAQSDNPQWAMVVGCDDPKGGFRSPIHSAGKQMSEEEEFDMLCIEAVEAVEKSVDSAKNNKPEGGETSRTEANTKSVFGEARDNSRWSNFDGPSFALLSDDEIHTPEPQLPAQCSSTILPLDDMHTGKTGSSIGLYSYADLPDKRILKPRNDDIYYFPIVKKRRIARNNAKNRSPPTIIDVDALKDTKEEKILKNRWNKNKNFQNLLDAYTRNSLKVYVEKAPIGESFWKADESGITDITRHEIDILLSTKALTTTIIDAYLCLLAEELMSRDDIALVTRSLYTHAWVAIENIDAVAMHEFVFEPLYENLGSAHLILIPLTHKQKFHFTLLTLDPISKCFFHYDSMSSRDSRSTECIKEADFMVHMINMWMRGVAFQADIMLNSGMRKKLNRGACSNVALQMDREALTEKEILTIKWVKENFDTNFKLIDQKSVVSKQAYGSLDCGVYVMHYMDDLAYERLPSETFDETAAMVFRADLIKRFARSSKRWRAAI